MYIYQAKAIFYGEWENLKTCILPYISNYPFFIAGVFAIFRDWIVAARSVSQIRFHFFRYHYPDSTLFAVKAFF
ncbi:MAG: hypothetical protein JRI99_15305 [Deltaproteobacteria bacterium]|nr:hypothetical protein [Deltaproteobacteria bacterium]